jgi:alkanesulfonate monooxygenase SsuD/methylene tetrahydromethanopterin reductase-like flavin-dependent oxidoreductase (luciferase family)
MLQLSGEIADGNVLSVLAGREYVRWARERIRAPNRVVTFAFVSVDDKAALRKPMAFYLAADRRNALTEAYGIADELEAMEDVEREMPDQWIEDLAIAGDPDECAEKIRGLLDAGSDAVALFPVAGDPETVVRTVGADVLPRCS